VTYGFEPQESVIADRFISNANCDTISTSITGMPNSRLGALRSMKIPIRSGRDFEIAARQAEW
jgi:hypothetical protein